MARTAEPDALRVEYRCPRHNTLFAVAVLAPLNGHAGDVIEVACQRCKQDANRSGGLAVERVLHRFSMGGAFVATLMQHRDGIG